MNYKNFILEKLITIGKKQRPKSDNVVVLAGGAGSGKGYVIDRLLGIEGKIFDVDELKKLAIKSTLLNARVKKEFGIDMNELELKNPDDVSTLHGIVSELGLAKSTQGIFLKSTIGKKEKPNIIFDTTMSTLSKLSGINDTVTPFGYKTENIHVVWVVNDLDTAIKQNLQRDRRVPEEILKDTHKHVALTMKNIIEDGNSVRKYADGDIWMVFNKRFVDSLMVTTKMPGKKGKGAWWDPKSDGKYITKAMYVKIKEQGKAMKSMGEIDKSVLAKIEEYTKTKFV